MNKILKYYKPFIVLIIVAVALLFIEARSELKLPDYISDIVNTGIQANGVKNVTPDYISEHSMNLMKLFMNNDEIKKVEESYTLISKGDSNYIDKYSVLKEQNMYLLKDDISNSKLDELNRVFSIASDTFINTFKSMNKSGNFDSQNMLGNNMDLSSLDVSTVNLMLSNTTQEVKDNARKVAEQTDPMMLKQVGISFTKMFYKEVGIDLNEYQAKYIAIVGAKMIGLCFVIIVTASIVGFLASKVGAGIARNLRALVFEKIEKFSTSEFDAFSTASLITRTTNDITQVQNITVMGIRMLAFAPIMGIGALLSMEAKASSMTWTILVGLSAIIVLIITVLMIVMPKVKIMQKLVDKLNLVSTENLSGLMVIRAFTTQKYEKDRFDKVNQEVSKNNQFVSRAMGFLMPYMMFVMNMLSVLIVWVGAHQIENSSMQVGDLMAVIQYAMQVVMSFLMISMVFFMLPRASVSAGRIAEVLEKDITVNDPEKPKKFEKSKTGYVEFKNVSFSYPDANEKVLENISFVAKPGETTAFIGSTGSGKSTLINLIPRFFDANDGEILVNGVNVKDVKQSELHEQIGYIPQKGSLLSGTIESNLKYGNREASDELMKKAAKVAQAIEFIESKEEKYNANISQGAKNVSGGQKQRLSIARALVKNPPIYIFDDSFSALDFKTDSELRKELKVYAKNSTVLIVAQRVSTIMNAEQIVVLDNGKIVGVGTHKQLLEKCPEYYEIASLQLSKEELENGTK